jgi:hypothetical protein
MNPRFFLLLKLALKFLLYLLAFIIVAYFIFSLVVRPSLNRDWTKDEQVLARATFDGNSKN